MHFICSELCHYAGGRESDINKEKQANSEKKEPSKVILTSVLPVVISYLLAT